MGEVAGRLRDICKRIEDVARRVGRDPSSVRLLGASKGQPIDRLSEAYSAGLRLFGENRMQELLIHQAELPRDTEWHFIGRLQRKKVKDVLPLVSLIHSLDNVSLAEEIDRRAKEIGKKALCLIEVNIDREESKGGISPDDLMPFVRSLEGFSSVNIVGLMAIPDPAHNADILRDRFREVASLCRQISDRLLPSCKELSIGMSGDFEIAIEEGATIVRLGESLFGARI